MLYGTRGENAKRDSPLARDDLKTLRGVAAGRVEDGLVVLEARRLEGPWGRSKIFLEPKTDGEARFAGLWGDGSGARQPTGGRGGVMPAKLGLSGILEKLRPEMALKNPAPRVELALRPVRCLLEESMAASTRCCDVARCGSVS